MVRTRISSPSKFSQALESAGSNQGTDNERYQSISLKPYPMMGHVYVSYKYHKITRPTFGYWEKLLLLFFPKLLEVERNESQISGSTQ